MAKIKVLSPLVRRDGTTLFPPYLIKRAKPPDKTILIFEKDK